MTDATEAAELRELEGMALQVEGELRARRALEVEELALSQYADVRIVERLHGTAGREVRLVLTDGSVVNGCLATAGIDWVAMRSGGDAVVPMSAVALVEGVGGVAIPQASWGIDAR